MRLLVYGCKADWIWREEIHIVKAHFRPNMVSVRSTCLCPQLEANRLHPLWALNAFAVGVGPPP
ncbi:MAG: hypothetical protein ACPLKQ_07910 [Candidatus Bathyarchaeales archaeon]